MTAPVLRRYQIDIIDRVAAEMMRRVWGAGGAGL